MKNDEFAELRLFYYMLTKAATSCLQFHLFSLAIWGFSCLAVVFEIDLFQA